AQETATTGVAGARLVGWVIDAWHRVSSVNPVAGAQESGRPAGLGTRAGRMITAAPEVVATNFSALAVCVRSFLAIRSPLRAPCRQRHWVEWRVTCTKSNPPSPSAS